ncbi:MAG: RidA family protein [Phycisphaerales bacterium]|nr:RidA family protein [Phycisphaerales bacterium]MCB9836451.1 RidA family protein [Phycisphaera sp.]
MPPAQIHTRAHVDTVLAEHGLSLPTPSKPVAAYVPTRRVGNVVYVSGQIPVVDGKLIAEGLVPTHVAEEEAQRCARRCILNGLAAVFAGIGEDEGIVQIIRLGCFVACTPDFTMHPKVANGASELLVMVLGDEGRHARAAVGCPSLPLNAPVEIELIVEVGKAG